MIPANLTREEIKKIKAISVVFNARYIFIQGTRWRMPVEKWVEEKRFKIS